MENTMNNETNAVNEVSAPATDTTITTNTQETTSAEMKNTVEKDLSGNPIPYARFKEKVDEYNNLKSEYEKIKTLEKFKEFEGYDTETFRNYMNLDKTLTENPDLYEQISKVIEAYSTGKKQIDETLDPAEAKMRELENEIKNLKTGVNKQTQEQVMSRYGVDFENLTNEKKLTAPEKELLSYYTEVAMALKTPDYRSRYNPQLLKDAFEAQYKRIEAVKNAAIDAYNAGKEEKKAPINTGGVHATQEVNMLDDESRRSFLIKELERIKNLNL